MRTTLMLAALLLVLAGCSSTSVDVKLVAVAPVNELEPGESRPVEVRLYQLKDEARFKAASVDDLWEKAKETLAEDLLDEKIGESIFPEKKDANPQGKTITLQPLKAETRFIGVLALYKQPADSGEQKIVVPLDQADDVVFELTGYHIGLRK
ncbi:MAG: type VI secretion system lipoprotein TssJ [Planctomycetes bacterium]|nr:type VI secretion system lipoprotein TssJ [Planctomycetota bacterium]